MRGEGGGIIGRARGEGRSILVWGEKGSWVMEGEGGIVDF